MAIVNIVSQTDSSKIAGVWGNGSLRTQYGFNYFAVPSASGTGVVMSVPGVLHSVVIGNSATAGTMFWLFDSASVAGVIGVSASAVGRYDLTTIGRRTDIFDAILGSGLTYRLSGAEGCDNLVITYTTGGFTA